MTIYAVFPLIATLAYIPLLIITLTARPWQRRQTFFVIFLFAAMSWSFADILLRGNFLPQYDLALFKIIVVTFAVMAVQFYLFVTTFYPPGRARWLVAAYVSLGAIVLATLMDRVTRDIVTIGDRVYHQYDLGVILVAVSIAVLGARSLYVLINTLSKLESPALYNQVVSLLVGISTMIAFALTIFLPWGREFSLSHFGNLVAAFVLTYAIIRHKLVDFRIVMRRGSAAVFLAIVGAVTYWLILQALGRLFGLQIDPAGTFVATGAAILVAVGLYYARGTLVAGINRIFQGESYDYRQNLSDFAGRIHNIFSLKDQGGELLALVAKAVDCKRACLLFPEGGGEDFASQFVEPKDNNPFSNLTLRGHSPIVEYLGWERKPLASDNLGILPGFLSLWEREKEEIRSKEVELFVPLISRGRLVAILVLGKKHSGRYSLEDLTLLESITNRVAVSIEKEYLREQLREREEELSVINRSSSIITSSLNIQATYDSFIKELKKVVDVSWAAITLIEEHNLYFLALSTEIGSAWKVGERIPIKGTATEWIATSRKPLFEPDLSRESRFSLGKYHLMQGVRSIAYFPLIVRDEVIGSLIVASSHPNAYGQRHMALLEQLASQIAMSVENARLYAKAEEKARVDELTGLLNRRALDEMLTSEIGRHSRYGGVFSIIILDLDSFKLFNDTYGHPMGDKLLRQLGGIIRGAVRSADQAFRYGGDEFAVLLPQTLTDSASQVAERIRKSIATKTRTANSQVTASLGLASWPADGIGPNELIAAADAALYQAKRGGGDRCHCASGTLMPIEDLLNSPTATLGSSASEDSGVLSTIYGLAATVDSRDHYTRDHSKRVSEYASALARALNLEPLEISRLETCAVLHDIGKIGIHDEILRKRMPLSDEEWEAVKVHPQLGATIVGRARQLAPCVAGILYHHEKWDGSGYPRGLKGEAIPLEARILAIADAFAAMISERPYAPVKSYDNVLEELKRNAGTQFDPRLVSAFLAIVKDKTLLPQGQS